jgi:hypothetical protein
MPGRWRGRAAPLFTRVHEVQRRAHGFDDERQCCPGLLLIEVAGMFGDIGDDARPDG